MCHLSTQRFVFLCLTVKHSCVIHIRMDDSYMPIGYRREKLAKNFLKTRKWLTVEEGIILINQSETDGISRSYPPKNRYKMLMQFMNILRILQSKHGLKYKIYPNKIDKYKDLAICIILETMQ